MEHRDGNGEAHRDRGDRFVLEADFRPSGDQGLAVTSLVDGLGNGLAHQTLLGVTGSGKTFTIANVVSTIQRPTLVLAPNKTLAAQLYGEMREFFPHNAVEYFVSYYDYYQPEAYIPSDRHVHREGRLDQRARGADAPLRHEGAARAGGHDHRRHRVGDLRPRRPGEIPRHGAPPRAGRPDRPA